jgi:hypothetical protein
LWEPVSFAYKKHRNSLEYLATNHAGFSKFNAHKEQSGFEQLNLYFSTRLALQKRDTDKENKTAKRQNTRNKTDVIGGNIIQLGAHESIMRCEETASEAILSRRSKALIVQ